MFPVAPQSNSAQTGTLDCVALGPHDVEFSPKILTRIAEYDIHANTIIILLTIGQQVILGSSGARRVREAIAACRAPENSVLELLSSSDKGLPFVGISAALSEEFPVDYVVEVLQEIVRHLKLNPELTPSLTLPQCSRVVKPCVGTLAKTDFGELVQKFRDLHGSETIESVGGTYEQFDNRWPSPSSERMAKAFVKLAQIAQTPESSIIIEGGKDVGFLAAVAEWLLDMNIVINDSSGAILYSNHELERPIQAYFVLVDRYSESSQSPNLKSES